MAVTISMDKDNGRMVHPFFMHKNDAARSLEIDFELNEGRRKRRRTASTGSQSQTSTNSPENSWIAQLQEAASGLPPKRGGTPDVGNSRSINSQESILHYHDLPLSAHEHCGVNAEPYSEADVDFSRAKTNAQTHTVEAGETSTKTPPRKMLEVRPDGKLCSPKALDSTQGQNPKRKRRSAKAGADIKSMIVKIKYGTDAQSRLSTSRKIDYILLDITDRPIQMKAKPAEQIHPSKPTHPFFLGGSARISQQSVLTQNKDVKESDPEPRKALNPVKARVTSKPPARLDDSVERASPRRITFGSEHVRISRFPGAVEALWPPRDMVPIGQGSTVSQTVHHQPKMSVTPAETRKLKDVLVQVPADEEVLKPYLDLVGVFRNDVGVSNAVKERNWRKIRRPLRRILTGHSLQMAISTDLAYDLRTPGLKSSEDQNQDELSSPRGVPFPPHKALQSLYERIATSLTAFDKFECESQDWTHKYAPKTAEEVLQKGREVILLREWLSSLNVNSVENCETSSESRHHSLVRKIGGSIYKRKRKKAEGLDGFVISSDEEAEQMSETTDFEDLGCTRSFLPKSFIRVGDASGSITSSDRSANTVVISGPHGCGKTAAVYAVARELGYEVFEINSGSRRSGKDLLDKVGDMTRNHLVSHDAVEESVEDKDEMDTHRVTSDKLDQNLQSRQQGTVNAYFKSKNSAKSKPGRKQRANPKPRNPSQKQQKQKQSLILLEEVDVLFDEDRMFWVSTLELMAQSKRPIIMTCTDEKLLPLDGIAPYAILRFASMTEQIAVDYLLLIACNEGHLLSRKAISGLYQSKGFDLRASISELNFCCQMAIGDAKGGLEWMLIGPPTKAPASQESLPLRVVSDGTYQHGMGWLGGEYHLYEHDLPMNEETELLSEAWHGWDTDAGTSEAYAIPTENTREDSGRNALEMLQNFSIVAEALSAADNWPAGISRSPNMLPLENLPSDLDEKLRCNYVERPSLLQAEPYVDHCSVSDMLAITLRVCCRRISHDRNLGVISDLPIINLINDSIMLTMRSRFSKKAVGHHAISEAFGPIARSTKAVLGIPKGPQISSFDGPSSVIAEDLAPYVRSIVAYDLRLEERRRQLSSLLSQPGHDGKRARTTRASRAALEGGSKSHTRRERWFPNDSDFDSILQSGGHGWQDILLHHSSQVTSDSVSAENESGGMSLCTALEDDI